MKKQIIVAAFVIASVLLTAIKGYAQIENVIAATDSSVILEKVYAGMLGATAYNPEKKDTLSKTLSFRVGVAAHYKINDRLLLRGFSVWDIDVLTNARLGINTLWFEYKPSKRWVIELGNAPTIVAQQHRPHPVTMFGHFETSTAARLPGSAPTVNVKFAPTEKLLLGGGISLRNSMPEYQLTSTVGRVQVTGYYQVFDTTIGASVTYTSDRLGNTFVYKDQKAIADFIYYQISKRKSLTVYTDFGYETPTKTIVRLETGILKIFKGKYAQGLMGFGLSHDVKASKEVNALNGYLMVTL